MLLAIVILSAPIWLRGIGEVLVQDDAPMRADAVLVLAGDYSGVRLLRGAELVRQGYAPKALIGGSTTAFGRNEADLAVEFAQSRGFPASFFDARQLKATSTVEEASEWKGELRRRGVRQLILVTTNFHTARALRTFRDVLGTGVEVRAVATPDRYFTPSTWWHTREGQKTVFYEISKTIAYSVGL